MASSEGNSIERGVIPAVARCDGEFDATEGDVMMCWIVRSLSEGVIASIVAGSTEEAEAGVIVLNPWIHSLDLSGGNECDDRQKTIATPFMPHM